MDQDSRYPVSRQQREASKRQRERRKAERAARKRERRSKKRGQGIAGSEEPEDLLLAPRAGRKPKVFTLVDEDLDEDAELEEFEDLHELDGFDDELASQR